MDGGFGRSGSYKTDMAAYLSLARDKTLDPRGYLQYMPRYWMRWSLTA